MGTSTPVVELHIVNGDSPTVRLEQDGSSGFTPQTWDMAVTRPTGSSVTPPTVPRLPLKIRPSAPTNSIFVDTDGDIGLQTSSPDAALHVRGTDGDTSVHIQELNNTQSGILLNVDSDSLTASSPLVHVDTATTGGTVTTMLNMVTAGSRPRMTMTHGTAGTWNFDVLNTTGNFAIIRAGGFPEYTFDAATGNLSIEGVFRSNGTTLAVPDYVFAEDYYLMPLDEVKSFIDEKSHLPAVPSAEEVREEGLDLTSMQLTLLRKVEELTLYTIDQHETISNQHDIISDQQDTIQQLMQRLEAVEAALQ